MTPLAKLLEAALFAASRPLTLEELAALEPGAGEGAVRAALEELGRSFATDDHGVELVEIAEGWQFLTRREYAEAVAFYRRLGYEVDDVVSLGKRMERDGPGPDGVEKR